MRDLYIALSGAMAQEKRLAVVANNLANVGTAGFKQDKPVFESLLPRIKPAFIEKSVSPELVLEPPPRELFGDKVFAGLERVFTLHDQGVLRPTENPLDFAIEGDGYFAVQTANGERYTRAGSFLLNNAHELVTQDGHKVLGAGGPIRLDSLKFSLTSEGTFLIDGEPGPRLKVVRFDDRGALAKEGKNLFAPPAGTAPKPVGAATVVRNNTVELSNVNMVDEMVQMIAVERAYQMTEQAISSINGAYATAIQGMLSG